MKASSPWPKSRSPLPIPCPQAPSLWGFRAEDAEVVASGGQINAPIYALELLGDATMVTVRVAGSLLSVRAAKNYRASIGDPVSIAVPTAICHWFDHASGTRIL